MVDALKELDKPSDILVIGNGFDLHCGLKSSFKNFFDSELRLANGRFNEERICGNIWYLIFTYAFMLDRDNGGKLVPFVNKNNPLWMDIEAYIDMVFKTKNLISELRIYDFINNRLHTSPKPDEYTFYSLFINGDYKNQSFQIGHRVDILRVRFNNVQDLLMFELNNFERDFSNYLKKEIDKTKETYTFNVADFMTNKLDNHGANEFFVLSFNYSYCFGQDINKENVINIHGTLERNNIIIGIGDYEKGGLPGRDIFKKAKRRVQYNFGGMNLPNKENIKSVSFYGCSFSMQDWNYYKLLFKKYRLEEQKIVFKFLYSDYCNSEEENNKVRLKYLENCTKAVNSYLQDNKVDLNFEDLYNLGCIIFGPVS